ncbi:MAG: hypothetical protein ACRDJE_04595 [Dehalococcoidia bacterium]
MQCEICETVVSERALFCEVCGHRVRRAAPNPVPPRPAVTEQPSNRTTPAAFAPPAPRAQPLVQREEVIAAVAARGELGDQLEPEVIDAFLARIESTMITRVDERIDARLRGKLPKAKGPDDPTLPVAICSLIFGIPISAIAASEAGGVLGLIVAWTGIAAVNFAVNRRKRED